MKINGKQHAVLTLSAAVIFFVVGFLRPVRFESETTFFVPLTFLEKQIAQNGMGFGSPIEVDAQLELLESAALDQLVEATYGPNCGHEVSRTRNGAVRVGAWAREPETAAALANSIVHWGDSLKQEMLRQNVGQSLSFVEETATKLDAETKGLRKTLDSLRFEAQTDSLALAALLFQNERQYGAAVVELTQLQRKEKTLRNYLNAPAPKSYIIAPAEVPDGPAGLSSMVLAVLGGLLAYVGFWAAVAAVKNK
ncbi:MAG: hypothetical protein RL754_1304 [Bacteroidota bacterium]|jgi:hypothetical protein